jgi:hypothetical protein
MNPVSINVSSGPSGKPMPVKGASRATPAEKAATMYGMNRAERRKAAKMQRRKQAKVG